MINIINQNKIRKQKINKMINLKEQKKEKKISTVIIYLECAAWGFVIAEIITLIVKQGG